MIVISYNHISERWYLSLGGVIIGKKRGYSTKQRALNAKLNIELKGKS